MGTIFKRGTRAKPRFYFQYRDGRLPDGRPRYTTHAATGARTHEDARKQLAQAEARLAQGPPAFQEPPPPKPPEPRTERLAGLFKEWKDGLTNRNAADDRSRIDRHLAPRFDDLAIEKVTLPVVMRWLDELRKTNLSGQTKRHLLNLLSRFFSWAIERGIATVNPVKMIPQGKRPRPQRPRDVPWLEDDTKVQALMQELGPVVGLMSYLGNRSGLRTGESRRAAHVGPGISPRRGDSGSVLLGWSAQRGQGRERKDQVGPGTGGCEQCAQAPSRTPQVEWREGRRPRLPLRTRQAAESPTHIELDRLPQGAHRGLLGRGGEERRCRHHLVPGDAALIRVAQPEERRQPR